MVLALTAASHAQVNGLVAAYSFNEGSGTAVADASGAGNPGVASNATWATGKYGGGLVFNGTSSRVNVSNSPSLQLTSAMTLEAWVNPSTVSNAWRDVIYKGDDNYYLEATSHTSSRPAGGGTFGGSNRNVFGTSALVANTWTHLALTYDGSTLRLYVNGSQAASTARTGAIATSTNQLQIGGDSLYGQYFKGTIDEVRVYNVALTAAQVQSDMNTAISTSTDATPPSTPGTLTATANGASEVDLSWGASTDNVGVTGYQVFRCAGSSCSNFALLTQVSGTTYADKSTVTGTTYGYEVRAIDAASNTGPFSNIASATPQAPTDTTPPSTPTGLATSGVTQSAVRLSWSASSDNVGVTGYQIYLDGSKIDSSSTTSYLYSGLACGTTHTLGVAAVDAAGNASGVATTSQQLAGCTDTTPPSAPGILASSTISASEIDLSWTAATDNVAVTGYQVFRCQGAGCGNFAQVAQPTGTTYNDTGLAASTAYTYKVRALDAAGNIGPYSNTSISTTSALASGLVAAYAFNEGSGTTAADASGTGNSGAVSNATWSATGKYGGALAFNGSSSRVNVPNSSSLQLTSAMTLEAWVNPSTTTSAWRDVIYKGDDNYYLEGTSDTSGRPAGGGTFGGANTHVLGTASLAPNVWTHLALTYDGATLSFYVNGTQVSSIPRTGAIATSSNQLQLGGDSLYGQYFSGLIDEVRIYNVARTAAQVQSDMNSAISTTPDTTPPSTPTGLATSGVTQSAVRLSWSASSDNVGVTGYQIYLDGSKIDSSSTTSYLYSGLACGTTHTLGVAAVDAAGNASGVATTSQQLAGCTDTTPPSAPGILASSTISASEIDLSWTAATDNVAVTGYQVFRCQGAGCGNFAQVAQPTGTTYNDTGLAASTAYTYKVRALDAAGNIGPYSNTTTSTTSAASDTQAPTAPGTPAASAVSASEIDVSWPAATDNVGVTGYQIYRCQGAGCVNFTQAGTSATTSYKDLGLGAATSYSYEIRALDAAGNTGPFSAQASATTQSNAGGGLVAAYSFDEGTGSTANDGSGNGNTGAVSSATWTTAGKYGGALSFNGSSARVNVANSSSLQLTSAMTLEAWVNPSTTTSAWRDVIYKGNDNYYLEGTSDQSGVPAAGATIGGAGTVVYGTTGALPANTWSHLAETYDGTTVRLYVNGTQVGTVSKTGLIATSTNQLQIGGDSIYGQYFSGLIDNVRIYNVALTAGQIQSDMGGSVGAPTAPTNLAASVVSTSEIDLSWTASTGANPVTGYRIERCQGPGCSNFSQVGTSATASFADTGLAADTSYSYRVRAVDSANNLSGYSNTATGLTGFSVAPRQYSITPGLSQQFNASGVGVGSVTWSVDGVSGGNSAVGTITTAGLYTAASAAGKHTITASAGASSASATVYVTDYAGNLTFHANNARTGANLSETVLTPANVSSSSFGKLASYPLDGLTFASPLYVENLSIPGQGVHNVVFVATEHDSVYAFDADGRTTAPLWHDSFIDPANGVTPIPPADTGELQDIPNEIGITGTPVIDPATKTMYVVAATKEVKGGSTSYVNRIHALDIATGTEQPGSPAVITASVPGTGVDAVNGRITFNNVTENQRAALLLSNGELYVAFANHGFNPPYHGWLLAYSPSTLTQDWAYCTSPNAESGGIWMGGDGVAADASGALYFATGNGPYDSQGDFGDSLLKLNPNGTLNDYFTPYNNAQLNAADSDLAAGGVILLPDQAGAHPHEIIATGKGGNIYVVDRDAMGHVGTSNDNQIVQSLVNVFPTGGSYNTGNYSAPTYLNSRVYFVPVTGPAMAFGVSNGLLTSGPTSQSTEIYNPRGARGGETTASANGQSNGILWALQSNSTTGPGVLRAYDPANLANEYYSSDQAGTRDQLDPWLKFTEPVVANGRVYVASSGSLTIFGLLP